MKIAIVLESNIDSGGGYNQAINSIHQFLRLSAGKYQVKVYTSSANNLSNLSNLGIEASLLKFGIIDKLSCYFFNNIFFKFFQRKFSLIGQFEKQLLNDGCDLIYFLEATNKCLSLTNLNYIYTVWDLAHRDSTEFPEVRINGIFEGRENLYKRTLSKSFLVIVDSKTLANKCISRYGIDEDKLLDMPFSPSPYFENSKTNDEHNSLALKYKIEEQYFYYPAQFWPHKNHIRILQALEILKKNKITKKVVFSGGDKGNLNYIKSKILELGLENDIKLLGFVSSSDVEILYKCSLAIIMPTYFGPTNIPPLEAWSFGKPLIYSSHLKEDLGGAALFFNPDSAEELAEAMIKVSDPEITSKLIENGYKKIKEINLMRKKSEEKLLDKLEMYSNRLDCWEKQ